MAVQEFDLLKKEAITQIATDLETAVAEDAAAAQLAETNAKTAQEITEGLRDETEAFRNAAAAIVSGGPRGIYADLAALIADNPDHLYTYVTLDNGYWNYWNGSAFVGGAQYQTPLAVVQTTGLSGTDVMSQKAVTDILVDTILGFNKIVAMQANSKDTLFVALGKTYSNTTVNIDITGIDSENVDWVSFYNSEHTLSKYIRKSSGVIVFDGTEYTDIRIELKTPVLELTNMSVSIIEDGTIKADVLLLTEEVDNIKNGIGYTWEYGNINTDGSIITPIAKNRLHTSLIEITNQRTVSCGEGKDMGYAIYDNGKTFIKRDWTDAPNTLDIEYIAASNPTARYISFLMENSDNSDFDLDTNVLSLSFETVVGNHPITSPMTVKMYPQTKLPVITFNFDDINPNDEQVVSLFESRGVRCGFAYIATDDNITDKKEVYKNYQKRGFDILNHSAGVSSIITANYTEAEAKGLIVGGMSKLQKAGFVVNGFVCPNSEISTEYLPIVKATHAYNMIGSSGGVYGSNTRSTDIGELLRYSLESNTTVNIKAYIDECIANDKCLVFYSHTVRFGTTIEGEVFNIDKVSEVLDYCIAKRDLCQCYVGGTDESIKYYFDL